jgi:hypothetical protein
VTRQFKRSPSVEAAPLQDECILFDPATNRFFVLNRTASRIWSRIERPATAEEIAREVASGFRGVTPERALGDVNRALERMLSLAVAVSVPAAGQGETSTEEPR